MSHFAPRLLGAARPEAADVAGAPAQRGGQRRAVDVAVVAEHDDGVAAPQPRGVATASSTSAVVVRLPAQQRGLVAQRGCDEPVADHDQRRHRPQRDRGTRAARPRPRRRSPRERRGRTAAAPDRRSRCASRMVSVVNTCVVSRPAPAVVVTKHSGSRCASRGHSCAG